MLSLFCASIFVFLGRAGGCLLGAAAVGLFAPAALWGRRPLPSLTHPAPLILCKCVNKYFQQLKRSSFKVFFDCLFAKNPH